MRHAGNKTNQAPLICMGRITAYGIHLSTNVIALPVKLLITTKRAKALDLPRGCAICPVANEQHIMLRIAQHSFEVVDDTPTGAHTVTHNGDGRLSGLNQAVEHSQVGLVAVDRE